MENNNSKTGKIIQVIGAVVDAEFPEGSTPEIYDALEVTYKLTDSESESKLVLETHIWEIIESERLQCLLRKEL